MLRWPISVPERHVHHYALDLLYSFQQYLAGIDGVEVGRVLATRPGNQVLRMATAYDTTTP